MIGGRPLVMLLEDLDQADISIEALRYIVRRLGPTPTLIAATYRPLEVDKSWIFPERSAASILLSTRCAAAPSPT